MFKTIFCQALNKIGAFLPLRLTVRHFDGTTQTVGDQSGRNVSLRFSSPEAYRRIVMSPSLGFGELYAENKIHIESPAGADGLFELLQAIFSLKQKQIFPWLAPVNRLRVWLGLRDNSPIESRVNATAHYDQNDEIVRMITGHEHLYSCAFFARPEWNLDAAQAGKMEYLLTKLQLAPGMQLLDVGCGYGALIRRAAKKFEANSLGVTLSERQLQEGRVQIQNEGLADHCRIELLDYRKISGRFDRIVSVGMYEHVGARNWRGFFEKIDSLLADEGIFVLHTVALSRPFPMDAFVRRHIFPGSELPTFAEVIKQAEHTQLQFRHAENLQSHYAKTLQCWLGNLRRNRDATTRRFGEWRYRAFEVYLAGGAASFSVSDGMQLGQFVFTKGAANWPATNEFITDWLRAQLKIGNK